MPIKPSRRAFLQTGALALAAPSSRALSTAAPTSFLDILRPPDAVTTYQRFAKTLPAERWRLDRRGEQWTGNGATVRTQVQTQTQSHTQALAITLQSPSQPVALIHLRWKLDVVPNLKVLGDAWERSYGELGWRNLIPERVLPWYCATYDGSATHGYGVQTGASALCFWQLDEQGISLWLNVTNGGDGVRLGERTLPVATVISRQGGSGEDSQQAVTALCRTLCARPSRPAQPIYGANDWCYSYGHSTAASILRDTDFIAGLSPQQGPRPFSVIDGGWTNATPAWPDMAALAHQIKQRNTRPGIWTRPLEAPADTPHAQLLPAARFGPRQQERAAELAFDPTHPEAQQAIREKIQMLAQWGYEMVKHDFSTYDLLGQWGFEMGPQPTLPGWSLHDRSLTNAEVISQLYSLIREAAGPDVLLDGCNTVGHLGQGLFDLQRTGDDTSGHQWERTRRMGINTLAFRLPQHNTFFTLDADLAGITDAVPWELNRQWLDALARSGTATMVSIAPEQRGLEQQAALREAFRIAAAGGTGARPTDWLNTSAPEHWRSSSTTAQNPETRYWWNSQDGASPFLSP